MAQLLPFCGWRFDLSQVGSLNDVTAPPTGEIDPELQDALYRRHPCNVVRLVRNRDEPGDTSSADRVTRADDFLKLWKKEGVLLHEHDDCFYICETSPPPATIRLAGAGNNEAPASRISVIARLATPRSAAEDIRHAGSLLARDIQPELELVRQCRTALAPVSGLVSINGPRPAQSLSEQLRMAVAGQTPIEMLDDSGVRHRIWPLARSWVSSALYTTLSHTNVLLTGSTAIFAAALLFRDECELRSDGSIPDEGACLHLVALVPEDDPGLRFAFPVWRLPLPSVMSTSSIISVLKESFDCQHVGSEAFAAGDAVELAALNSRQPCLALGTADGEWMMISRIGDTESQPDSRLVSRRRLAEDISRAFGILATDLQLSTVVNPATANQQPQTPGRTIVLLSPATEAEDLLSVTGSELSQMLQIQTVLTNPVPTGLVFSMPD